MWTGPLSAAIPYGRLLGEVPMNSLETPLALLVPRCIVRLALVTERGIMRGRVNEARIRVAAAVGHCSLLLLRLLH